MYFHLELRGPHAGELSYVLGKNPDRLFEWEVQGSMVRVFFPIHQAERSRAVALFWPDPRGFARRNMRSYRIEDQVSPRHYTLNSLFCSALKTAFNSAISGHRQAPPEVLERAHDLELVLSPIGTYLSAERVSSLFEPLGYAVSLREMPQSAEELLLRHPRIFDLTLTGQLRVTDVLRHVMVLALVIDSDRHEYMGQADIDRLRRLGAGWLDEHPDRVFLISRYLIYRRLIDGYLQAGKGASPDPETPEQSEDGYDAAGEPMPIRQAGDQQRYQQLVDMLLALAEPPVKVLQIGCGDGKLLSELVSRGGFEEVVGADPSAGLLERARKRVERAIRYTQVLRRHPTRFELIVSALGYHDPRLQGFDTVLVHDVVDHLEASRLTFLLAPILQTWRPRVLVLSVANREHSTMPMDRDREGRSGQERVEWDRSSFRRFCETLAHGQGYAIDLTGLGMESVDRGAPTLLAIFHRVGGAA